MDRVERAPNWHHTLYYKRNFEKFSYTYQWREHLVMIVPLPYYDHVDLHKAVPPVDALPSKYLAKHALYICDSIQIESASITHLEAFSSVRDELFGFYRRNKVSELGRESLKYSDQFSRQIEFMSEVPRLGTEWDNDWMRSREPRIRERLQALQDSER